MKLINIGFVIACIGLGILFILGSNSGWEGQMSKTEGLWFGVPICIGGLIIIFCRLTDREDGEW